MRKITLIIFICLVSFFAKAQTPFTTPNYQISSKTKIMQILGAARADSGYIFGGVFSDTTAANAAAISLYPHGTIVVGDSVWIRNLLATRWINMMRGGGSSGSSQTWQQTLTTGSTLTGNNTIAGGGFDLKFNNSNFYVGTLGGNSNRLVWNDNSGLLYNTTMQIVADSISPYLGITPSGDSTTLYYVLDSTCTIPGAPTAGDAYMVCGSPSGAWSGHAYDIATWNGASWDFTTPAVNNNAQITTGANAQRTYIFRFGTWQRTSGIPSLVGGNKIGAEVSVGTIDNQVFKIKTNNVSRLGIRSNGIFDFYSLNGTGKTLMALSSTGQASRFTGSTGSIPYFSATNVISNLPIGTSAQHLVVVGGIPAWVDTAVVSGSTVVSVSGTANRITSTGGTTPVIDIAATYVGQTSLTTLGTITTGTWNGTKISEAYGGTNQSTYTTGDMLYASGSNTLSKLAIGATGQHLVVVGGVPVWRDTTAVGASGVTTFSAGTTGFTPNSATSGAVTLAGTLVLANGGTNANLTASNGGIFYSTASAGAILSGTATANKMLLSGATAAPTWSTSTIPSSAGATANKVLLSDGTNYVLSTPTFPNASATSGKFIISDGTNWIASTPTLPNAAGTSGNVLTSDGTNFVSSAPAAPTGAWLLASGGTLTGANTITSNANGQLTFNGTYTTTANTQNYSNWTPSITLRNTASDEAYGLRLAPTFISGAASQVGTALTIDPTWTNGGSGLPTKVAIKYNGSILVQTNDTYPIGAAAAYVSNTFTNITTTSTLTMLSGSASTLTYKDASAGTVGRMFVSGDLELAQNGAIDASSNGYKFQAKGEGSFNGGVVIPALAQPSGSVANIGVAGATTYTYVIVANLTNGGTTQASANITTTTGNATLSGSNLNRITITDVPGARTYTIYRTVGGATQGIIGTRNSQTGSSFDDNGKSGGGQTAPTTNSTGNLGLATTTPNSILQVNGSVAFAYVAKTATYTATVNDHTINCTSGTFTVTLPTAVGISGRIYTVVNSGSGTVTIGTTSSQTFVNINTAPTTLTLGAVGAAAITSYTIMSNGANWIVTAKVKDE